MRTPALLLIVGASLLGCEKVPDDTFRVKITLVDTPADVYKLCDKDPIEGFGCLKGARSAINPDATFEVVAVKPRGFDDHAALETLGHEVLHMLWGPVHR